jgi:hypothetical protein
MRSTTLVSARILAACALAITVAFAPSVVPAQNAVPAPPTLVSPGNLTQVTANPPTFMAIAGSDPDGDSQRVQIAIYQDDTLFVQGSDFMVPVVEGDTVTWTATDTLHENWFYFWTARSWDGTDTTPKFGHMASFTVNAVNEPPTAAELIAPTDDSTVFTTYPWFHWTRATDPDFYDTLTYTIWASHRDCVMTFLEMDLVDTFYQSPVSLYTGRRYMWGVHTIDHKGGITVTPGEWFWTYLPGDVDLSHAITATDVILAVQYVFLGVPLNMPECVADATADGSVTAADIIMIILHLFKSGPSPPPTCDP